MRDNRYRVNLASLEETPISHGNGRKRVFIRAGQTETNLTQFAWAKILPGEGCEKHSHLTMEEYFFVLGGEGTYAIGDEVIDIQAGDFIRVPADTEHQLSVENGNKPLELVYFGIATV